MADVIDTAVELVHDGKPTSAVSVGNSRGRTTRRTSKRAHAIVGKNDRHFRAG
jgi:hypothetical protein